MQKNGAIVSVCILCAAMLGGVVCCADGETMAIEILFLASTVVCLILLMIRHPLHTKDSAGTTITTIPASCAVLQVISPHKIGLTFGLLQQ